jgi:transmembrane sensor
MKSTERHAIAEERLEAAAQWLVRLREEPTNATVLTAWLQWCDEHADNTRAFESIQEIWNLSGETALPFNTQAQNDLRDNTDSHQDLGWRETDLVDRGPPATRSFRWRYAAGLATAAAAALLVAVVWRGDFPSFDPAQATEYATAQAVDREVQLSDGSVLRLGGASTVRVAYSAGQRDVELLQGEAYFKVQHDAVRPFVVRTHGIAVTAVGTAFNVRTDAGRTVVIVSEGVVEVVPRSTQTADRQRRSSVRAVAGEQVTLEMSENAAERTLAVKLNDAPAIDDWQEGLLSFVDEPLRTVVVRVNRYSRHDVVLGDAATGDLRFTGTVFRDSIEDWVKGLERAFPVHADAHADGRIILSRDRGAGPE